MRKWIFYFLDPTTGLIWSRMDDKVAIPILDFEGMRPEDNFSTNYLLEKHDLWDVISNFRYLTPVSYKKVPKKIKEEHRSFWGFKLSRQGKEVLTNANTSL